jgi:hypothetical protein
LALSGTVHPAPLGAFHSVCSRRGARPRCLVTALDAEGAVAVEVPLVLLDRLAPATVEVAPLSQVAPHSVLEAALFKPAVGGRDGAGGYGGRGDGARRGAASAGGGGGAA